MFDDIDTLCATIVDGLRVGAMAAATLAPSQDLETLTRAAASLERVRRAADAAQLAVLADIGRRGHDRGPDGSLVETRTPPGLVAEMAPDVVAMTLDCRPHESRVRTELAVRLAHDLDPLLRPLLEGEVPEDTLRLVADETADASSQGVRACVGHLLAAKRGTRTPRLQALDRHDLAQACRRVLDRTDPGWREARAAQNRTTRTDVTTYPGPTGTTVIAATLPSEVALVITASVDQLARQRRRDDPDLTAGAARAMALADLAMRGVEVSTHVTLGLALVHGSGPGSGSGSGSGCGPARPGFVPSGGNETAPAWVGGVEVPRLGWIPGSVVQTLVERLDTRVTRALLDPEEGTVSETSSVGYVPSPAVRRLVQLRDTRCRMWGCSRRVADCDLDHAVPYPAGPTAGANLSGLCRHHHRVKHAPGWRHTLHADGTTEWTSPGGTQRVTWPTAYAAAVPDHPAWRPSSLHAGPPIGPIAMEPSGDLVDAGTEGAVTEGADVGSPPF
ncbi:HNH endonuclease signature motif containing protein [Janibacter massiliensis]|uniref:HNH endonuclease signature motif containing protein n=1 Tax=Janibacter massiliensis TaxID=2058291 RepID=UPI000D10D993|nr:HNH endonuclease signature motif containing protein [Janibacter massiliensis]